MFEVLPEGKQNKEKEQNKLSRRDFLRVATGLTLAGAGTLAGGYFAKKGLGELGLRFEEQNADQLSSKNFFDEEARILSEQTKEAPTQTAELSPEATTATEKSPEPTSTPEIPNYFNFGQIDFEKDEQIGASFFIEQDQVVIPYFNPRTWEPNILSSGEFDPNRNTGLVYLDSGNRKILNLHSGRLGPLDEQGFSAYKLQIYFEEHPNIGVRRYSAEVQEALNDTIGSEVVFKQGENFAYSDVIAAVRVPPNLVNESKEHVYNINEWLANTFPESGFNKVLNNEKEILTLKFCGRKLAGEPDAEGEPSFRQSRFFMAMKLI
jgi:hypothetical protein